MSPGGSIPGVAATGKTPYAVCAGNHELDWGVPGTKEPSFGHDASGSQPP